MSLPNELMDLSNAIFHSVDKLTLRLLKKAKFEINYNNSLNKGDFIKNHYDLLERLIQKIKCELSNSSDTSCEVNLDYDPKNKVAEMDVTLSTMVELLTMYRSELLYYIQEKSHENNVSTKTSHILMNKLIKYLIKQ